MPKPTDPPENWREDVVRLQEENTVLHSIINEIEGLESDSHLTTREKVLRIRKVVQKSKEPKPPKTEVRELLSMIAREAQGELDTQVETVLNFLTENPDVEEEVNEELE